MSTTSWVIVISISYYHSFGSSLLAIRSCISFWGTNNSSHAPSLGRYTFCCFIASLLFFESLWVLADCCACVHTKPEGAITQLVEPTLLPVISSLEVILATGFGGRGTLGASTSNKVHSYCCACVSWGTENLSTNSSTWSLISYLSHLRFSCLLLDHYK